MPLPPSPRVVITGAGSGFGRALALELSPRTADLILADVDEAGAAETARLSLQAGARRARPVRCDVAKLEDVQALAELAEAGPNGGVDLVVNNAGVSSGGAVGKSPIEDWRWTIEVDLFGVIYGCHVFVPILRKQGNGHVLNVASAAGLLAPPRLGAYNVAKAGVVALSETLSAELNGTKIGVTVLCPTFFRTNILSTSRFLDQRLRKHAENFIANGKSAESIARAALRSVENNELFSIPMADGRWFWRLKRLIPSAYPALAGRVTRLLKI